MANEQTVHTGGIGLPKGERIGKYEVVERLGMGGQAVVYKGYDALLDRYVALKQISAHLASDEKFLERFRREAQILAKLGGEQESIVTIHELIEDERGLFIVMEYLAGHSLETVLEDTKGPSEPKAVLQIIWRLAAALHAVHNAGIIHRDLKPSNIIVCEGLRAKITDFGVAASISGQTSMILGTTKYMAPELFEGGQVDGRADMYSLGFIAYELLAGRPKFNEIFAEIVRDKHSEALRWMKWHGNTAIHAPLLEEVNPAVPVALSQIVAKMMDKDVSKRFGNMEQLGRAIKMSFSPRGKPAGGAAAARRRRMVPAPVTPAELTAADSGAALAPPEAGDELEVAPVGAATAPLPSSRLGRKLLMFFVLPVVILSLLGLGAVGVYRFMQGRAARERQAQIANSTYFEAEKTMIGALKSYDRAKFDKAAAGFRDIQKRFPRSVYAVQASVWQPLCEAYLAMADGKWEEAVLRESAAIERNNWVQANRDDLGDWARRARGNLKSFRSYYLGTRQFRETMERADKAFQKRDYDETRMILQRELRDVVLTPDQERQVERFRDMVNLTEFRGLLVGQMQKAEDLLSQNKFAEA